MSELSTPMPDPVEEESHDIPVTRRQLLRTMAAGGVALAGGTALAACGGSPSTSTTSNGPVDLTLWMNPAVPEVSAPPDNWSFYKIVKQKFNINLKVEASASGE